MKIGYSVEGGTDRAMLNGLRDRWCPQAELIEGHFRGETGESRRREIRSICLELNLKSADFITLLTDSNSDDPNAWKQVERDEDRRVPKEYGRLVVVGVCQRNVECWLCADKDWIAQRLGRKAADFGQSDPKGVFKSAMGITSFDKKENEIAELVNEAPLEKWLGESPSFERFFDRLWQKSKEMGCAIENLRDRGSQR